MLSTRGNLIATRIAVEYFGSSRGKFSPRRCKEDRSGSWRHTVSCGLDWNVSFGSSAKTRA